MRKPFAWILVQGLRRKEEFKAMKTAFRLRTKGFFIYESDFFGQKNAVFFRASQA